MIVLWNPRKITPEGVYSRRRWRDVPCCRVLQFAYGETLNDVDCDSVPRLLSFKQTKP
ncbi:hypothetical protein DPMN_075166 [Dreissena polymorpha]|uniref:Uncharacterized protein n=1 Tax=Dreissena polymorpha TaxID=45954 RepID=A0A9D3YJ19_DREPO|nr:hypothetical protein DPMN_075166 [Dreissena polymorpha]